MHLITTNIAIPMFSDVRTKFYNRKLNATVEMAELEAQINYLNQAIDQYYTLRTLEQLYTYDKCTPSAKAVAKAYSPSVEVNIFSIGGAIVKAFYTLCKWLLSAVGHMWKWFMSFFNRDIKDARKDITDISSTLSLCQNDAIGLGVQESEVSKVNTIVEAHVKEHTTVPQSTPGMKIEAYKTVFFQNFNSKVPHIAQVNQKGEWLTPITYRRGMVIGALGWKTTDILTKGADMIEQSESAVKGVLDNLRSQGGDVKKVINLCEANGYVKNNFIEEKGPGILDSACICSILVNDIKVLKKTEDVYVQMMTNIRKAAGKYVAAKT